MNTVRILAPFALLLALSACGTADFTAPGATAGSAVAAGGSEKPAAAAGGAEIQGLPLVVELPAGAVPNDGAPGFHSDDESIYVMIKKVGEAEAKTMEAAKKASEEFLFKKWVKSEKTADGWILSWIAVGMDMSGKEYDSNSFSVRRKIGDVDYECYGGLKKAADVEKNIKLCQAIKAAP